MWCGLNTEGIPEKQGHQKDYIWDLEKQKETFLHVKQDFYDKGASSSNTKDIRRELVTIPLQTNPYVEEVHQQVNIEACVESKHLALVKSFL